MKTGFHRSMALLAMLCIATFLVSTVIAELSGDPVWIAATKRYIVYGLGLLIPALALTGLSGQMLGRTRGGRLVAAKQRRMKLIAANGLLVLTPCALTLNLLAGSGDFGPGFIAVQILELIAGAGNLTLMGLMARDGLRLTGRLRGSTAGDRQTGGEAIVRPKTL